MTSGGRWRQLLPEAGRCWVAWAPEGWPGSSAPWTALDRLGLGEGGIGFGLEVWGERALDGVAWLPPSPASLTDSREGLARAHADRGTPLIWHRLPGDAVAPSSAVDLLDLLPSLVAGEDLVHATRDVAAGGIVVLPLVAGLAGTPERWDAVARVATEVGAAAVVPLRLELEPTERRRLVDLAGEALFEPIFHGEAPSEREVAVVLAAAGIAVLPPRPLPRPPLRGASNRALAGLLLEAAELALRLGEPEPVATALFTAGRFVDTTRYDVAGLIRDQLHRAVPELAPAAVLAILDDRESPPVALARRRFAWAGCVG